MTTAKHGKPVLQFWFDFASTYSYLSAMRIEALAATRSVSIVWKPFLLGPIFAGQGWTTSPFNIYPAKGRNMIRDLERLATARGLDFRMPAPFPQASLKAARLALAADELGALPAFSRAVFAAEFGAGASIADDAVLARIAEGLGLDFAALFRRSETPDIKARLRQETATAQTAGLFGAPSFVTAGGELFWGDDRLPQALDWACGL